MKNPKYLKITTPRNMANRTQEKIFIELVDGKYLKNDFCLNNYTFRMGFNKSKNLRGSNTLFNSVENFYRNSVSECRAYEIGQQHSRIYNQNYTNLHERNNLRGNWKKVETLVGTEHIKYAKVIKAGTDIYKSGLYGKLRTLYDVKLIY